MSKKISKVLVILTLIFFYPFGIPLMFITKTFTKKTRWIITLSFLLAIVIGLTALILFSGDPNYIN